jgi:hypothetical protein
MKKFRFGLVAACAFGALALTALPAGAGQVDQPCFEPSGDNGATSCTFIVDMSISGPSLSPTVIECFGEDVFVDLRAHVVGHEVFRPDGSTLATAHAEIHGSGYGLVSGIQVIFNSPVSGTIDNLPDGGFLLHEVTSGEVITQGAPANLEFTIELQELIAPDGTVKNQTLNAQANCGSVHEHLHQ